MTTSTLRRTRAKLLPLAIYVRLSVKPRNGKVRGSSGQAPSIERQIKRGIAKAKELGRPYLIYNEGVTSAFKGKRPEYARLIQDLRAGVLYGVIAWHEDRLCRNNRETLDWIDLTKELNFPTYTCTTGLLDLSTANGRAAAITIGAWNRAKSEHISEQVRDELQEKALRGEYLGGGRPFGYEEDGMIPREDEAEELRKATLAINAGESLGSILKDWNSRGILTSRGNKWGYPSLRELLLRERNAGWSIYQGKVVGKAMWPAIVEEEDFRTCQRILNDEGRTTTPGPARKYLLGGIPICPKCGGRMQSGRTSDRTKTSYLIYRCCVYRSQPRLDALVSLTVQVLLGTKSARKLLTPPKKGNVDLSKKRADINRKMKEAAKAFTNDQITMDQLTDINGDLMAQLEEVDSQMKDHNRVRVFGELLSGGDLRKQWGKLSMDRKRAVINALFEITVLPVGRGFKGKFGDGIQFRLKNEGAQTFTHDELLKVLGTIDLETDAYRDLVRAFS